jgi:hypothetical protein
MPLSCDRDGCNAAVALVDDNGETDARRDRLEVYECSAGHRFTVLLEGTHE